MYSSTLALTLLMTASTIFHKVSATGCATHTFGSCEDGIVHWYDPDDGMVCDPIDCGGGRAPPKSTNPCCAAYTGTDACVTATSYLSCFARASATTTSSAVVPDETAAPAPTTTTISMSDTSSPVLTGTRESLGAVTSTATVTGSGSSSSSAATELITGSVSSTTTRSVGGSGASSRTTTSVSTSTTPNAADHVQRGSLRMLIGAVAGMVLL